MSTLTATPTNVRPSGSVMLAYTGSLGGSLRVTRPNGSRYYLTTVVGSGSRTYTPTTTGTYRADLFTRKSPLKILVSTSFGVTAVTVPPPPVTPPPPANAVRVAREGGTFTLPRAGLVWYGFPPAWASRQYAAGSVVPCTNAVFGDPIPGVVKACYAVIPAPVLTAVAGLRLVDLAWTA